MNFKPSISVVIPTYNRGQEIVASVESVLAQTLPVSEVIIIDDGSVGEIPETIQRMIAEKPAWRERVRYFYQENQGQSAARNNGISRARGEWLAFNDSDDLWLPQKLEWQFQALEKGNGHCGLCFTDGWWMNNPRMKMTMFQLAGACYETGMGTVEDLPGLVERLPQVWIQTVVARADLIRQVRFDEKIRYLEDQDFLFRMALVTKFCYVNMPMILIDRTPAKERHKGPSLEWHKEEFRLRNIQYRDEKNLSHNEALDPKIKKLLRRSLRQVHSSWANRHMRSGDYDKARGSVSKAAEYELTPGIALKWALIRTAPWVMKRALRSREQSELRVGFDPLK